MISEQGLLYEVPFVFGGAIEGVASGWRGVAIYIGLVPGIDAVGARVIEDGMWQVGDTDTIMVAGQDRGLDGVREFADVAWPWVSLQACGRTGLETPYRSLVLAVEDAEKVIGEEVDITVALA
jgi:hypothetical protein